MNRKYEAPPWESGDFEKRFDGQSKTFSKYTNCNVSFQGPRHIGEIANGLLLEAAETRFKKLAKCLSHCRGPALIDIKRELFTLATLIDELRGDRRAA